MQNTNGLLQTQRTTYTTIPTPLSEWAGWGGYIVFADTGQGTHHVGSVSALSSLPLRYGCVCCVVVLNVLILFL